MGIRLNTIANPAFRAGLDAPGPAPGVGIPAANRVGPIEPQPVAAPAGFGVAGAGTAAVAGPAAAPARAPQAPIGANQFAGANPANPADDNPTAGETGAIRAATERAEAVREANEAPPAARLRDFRFLTAAESPLERDLETRLKRLERELESAGNRLQSNTFSVRVDAQLDRARLERDLEMVASQIGRLRLERVFAQASTAEAALPAQAAAEESQPAEPRVPGLDLLA